MNIIYSLDLLGTFTFAISGALSAANKKFDIFGALFIGFITAVGGGTIRDLVLGNTPVFWIKDINYLLPILISVLLVFIFTKKIVRFRNPLLFFDAIGIGVFTLIGIQKSINFNILPVFSILLGVITAVMGGIFRDIFCHEIPLIFHKEIYATACLLGGIVFFILHYFGINQNITFFVTMITIITIRLVSIKFELSLPKISL